MAFGEKSGSQGGRAQRRGQKAGQAEIGRARGGAQNAARSRRRALFGSALSALAVAALAAPATALADEAGSSPSRWGVQLAGGVADHGVKKADFGVVYDPNWTWWEVGGWHFAFVAEGHVAYWHASESNAVHPNVWEVGATPVIRFVKSSGYIRPFAEAGVGVRLISHPRITQDYTMSSAFQFADMVGVGAQFGERQQWQAGFRFQHLSNAGIKHPNPGINFSQLYAQWNF